MGWQRRWIFTKSIWRIISKFDFVHKKGRQVNSCRPFFSMTALRLLKYTHVYFILVQQLNGYGIEVPDLIAVFANGAVG